MMLYKVLLAAAVIGGLGELTYCGFLIWPETGPWTALALGFVALETRIIRIKKLKQALLDKR